MNHVSSRNPIFDVPDAQTYEKCTFSLNRLGWTSWQERRFNYIYEMALKIKIMTLCGPHDQGPRTQALRNPVAIYIYIYIYWARGIHVIRVPGGTRTGIILNMAGVLKTTLLVQSDRFSENVNFSWV